MKFEIKEQYKGYTIEFVDHKGIWIGICNENEVQAKDTESLLKKIDKACNAKKEFTRYVIVYAYWGQLNRALVTSITDDGEYWVISENGNRTKLDEKTPIRKYEEIKDLYNEYLAVEKAEKEQNDFYEKQKEVLAFKIMCKEGK